MSVATARTGLPSLENGFEGQMIAYYDERNRFERAGCRRLERTTSESGRGGGADLGGLQAAVVTSGFHKSSTCAIFPLFWLISSQKPLVKNLIRCVRSSKVVLQHSGQQSALASAQLSRRHLTSAASASGVCPSCLLCWSPNRYCQAITRAQTRLEATKSPETPQPLCEGSRASRDGGRRADGHTGEDDDGGLWCCLCILIASLRLCCISGGPVRCSGRLPNRTASNSTAPRQWHGRSVAANKPPQTPPSRPPALHEIACTSLVCVSTIKGAARHESVQKGNMCGVLGLPLV